MFCLIPSAYQNTTKFKVRYYSCYGFCTITVLVIMSKDLITLHTLTHDVAFETIPLYVHILTILISSGFQIQKMSKCVPDEENLTTFQRFCWALPIICLIVSQVEQIVNGSHNRPETILQRIFGLISFLFEFHYFMIYVKFKNDYQKLNNCIKEECFSAKDLLTIRIQRKSMNKRVRNATKMFGIQAISVIMMTTITTAFKIHRTLRSNDRFTVMPADLLDSLQWILRLFLLCKVSRDVAKEANDIETQLLNLNTESDENFDNEVSFFLWEINNPPMEVVVYGLFVLDLRLLVSVISWCIGFVLILLQFRWPRIY
ncbi:uncharacterized protein LOC126896218 [Daktulosphaira vitifoliae]|uniref:uncharacterized protein LOC126896218 n=1 Tax=Daktulosphaira vitifoliae TaxID=58002 RepID=UPI0021AB0115|nr:uncharacterized protein LOC126896218 [Daktulosphaira vitifoliae]